MKRIKRKSTAGVREKPMKLSEIRAALKAHEERQRAAGKPVRPVSHNYISTP